MSDRPPILWHTGDQHREMLCIRRTCVVGKWDHQIVVAASTALQGLSTFVVAIPIRVCG